MTSGYIRQSAANIQPNLVINAEDLNAEYNAIQTAFDNTAGHDHSGSVSGDGAKIPLTTAVSGVLPVANGGTGDSTLTANELLLGNGTSPVTQVGSLGTTTTVLHGNASGAPTFGSVNLSTDVSSILPIINGGTGSVAIPLGINKLINPFMEIDQANEGAAVSLPSTFGSYIVDGFAFGNASIGTTSSSQRIFDGPPGSPGFCVQYTMGSGGSIVAGTFITFDSRLESDDTCDTQFGLATAQSLALSFWVKSSVSGTYSGSIRNGATTRAYVFNFSVPTPNVWQLITQVVPGDTGGVWIGSGSGIGMIFDICLGAGSTFQTTPNTWATGNFIATSSTSTTFITTNGATFKVGPCKLEIGTQPTPMIRTNVQEELARCQRYYEKSYDPGIAPGHVGGVGAGISIVFLAQSGASFTNGGAMVYFKASKRADPTVSIFSVISGTIGKAVDANTSADVTATVGNNGAQSFIWTAPLSASSSTLNLQAHWVADARL